MIFQVNMISLNAYDLDLAGSVGHDKTESLTDTVQHAFCVFNS